MSLFGGLMDDFDDDPFFGAHMRSVRQMNNMMNSLFADPFGMMGGFGGLAPLQDASGIRGSHDSLMPFGFPSMNINRLLGGSLDGLANINNGNCHSFASSSVVRMSSGPDGRPQVYRASASSRTGPDGIREIQRSEENSQTGTKKLAIGHHIGERAHIIEREQNVLSGDQEERQEFINLDEEEADDFNREWETKTRRLPHHLAITSGASRQRQPRLALPSSTSTVPAGHRRSRINRTAANPLVCPRRSIRPSPLALPQSSSSSTSNRMPYSTPGQPSTGRRHQRNIKSVSGQPDI